MNLTGPFSSSRKLNSAWELLLVDDLDDVHGHGTMEVEAAAPARFLQPGFSFIT